jgi:tRNA A-37 threonylcarbamoyl transferase component Bud32/tetratricopeptide (TPR) repeat protein
MTERDAHGNTLFAGRYVIEGPLGSGATSDVVAARDTATGLPVAIKRLRKEVAAELGTIRFLRETALVATLEHDRILPILDHGEVGGVPFYVMPRVDGQTLRERLDRERQLPLAVAISIARDVADALDHAHSRGVIHRDIKPENILLEGDRAVVSDFGIALALDASDGNRITASGISVGTPQYMSPEQAAGERYLDGRADTYALACVTYEMLAGEPPFSGATAQAVRARHALEKPPSILVVRPALPATVDAALREALAKAPADRPALANDFVTRLTAQVPRKPFGSRRRQMALGLVVVAILAVGIAVLHNTKSPGSTHRRWILVGDFSTPADDPTLGRAVRALTVAELGQSDAFSLVPQEQIQIARRAAQLPDSLPLDLDRAREIAVRSSVRVFVTGSVSRMGPHGYSVAVHAIDADDSSNLLSESGTATDSADVLVQTVERLVRGVRRRLGERPTVIDATRPLQNVNTPSFAAFRQFQDAQAMIRSGDVEGGMHLLRRATAEDSGFAAAWALLAAQFVASRQLDSAKAAYERAAAHPERLGGPELDRLRGDMAAFVDRQLDSAIFYYDRYLAQRPASLSAHNNRAGFLSSMGRHREALDEMRIAMSIDPLFVGARSIEILNTALEFAALGQLDSARALTARLAGADHDFAALVLLSAESRWDSLGALARRLTDDPSTPRFVRFPATNALAASRAALGDAAGADSLLARSMNAASGADARWFVHVRALLAAQRGMPITWRLPTGIVRDPSIEAQFARGEWSVGRGALATATAIADSLGRRPLAEQRRIGGGAAYLTALVALARNDAAGAAAAIANPAKLGEHDSYELDRPSSLALRRVAAVALERSGRIREAREMRDALVSPEGLPPIHMVLRGLIVSLSH